MTIPLERQIACVRRELAKRKRFYPRWTAAGRLPQAEAEKEIAEMEAVLETLRGLQAQVQPDLLGRSF